MKTEALSLNYLTEALTKFASFLNQDILKLLTLPDFPLEARKFFKVENKQNIVIEYIVSTKQVRITSSNPIYYDMDDGDYDCVTVKAFEVMDILRLFYAETKSLVREVAKNRAEKELLEQLTRTKLYEARLGHYFYE